MFLSHRNQSIGLSPNQLTGFYMRGTLAFNGLMFYRYFVFQATHKQFFLKRDSLHARLNSHYKAWSYKKKKTGNHKTYRESLL